MKNKTTAWIAALLLCALPLGGCGDTGAQGSAPASTPTPTPAATAAAATQSEPAPAGSAATALPTATPEPTASPEPQGVYSAETYAYFERVGFSGGRGGTPVTAKWETPIRLQVLGRPGDGDIRALGELLAGIKAVRGMPEITVVTEGGNFTIGYLPKSKGREADGGYDGSAFAHVSVSLGGGASPAAQIFIADELISQQDRDAWLSSLLFEGLGLAVDEKGEYSDSVLNRKIQASRPSDMDWRMLGLLYCPDVKPGLAAAEAMPAAVAADPGNGPAQAAGRSETLGYFNEVGFYWAQGRRDGAASKWSSPILLQVGGTPTADQQALLDEYISRLNAIEGFPGITLAPAGGNLTITFAERSEIEKSFPGLSGAEACACRPERGKNDAIVKCSLCVATDFGDAAEVRSQLLRALIWSLGLNFTSGTRPDSILNLDAHAGDWSDMDWAMLELLYRPDVKCGARRAEVMKMLGEIPR